MTRRNGTSQGCGGSQVQFSIVVPAYNAQDGLAACLRSVLAQDFDAARFELVVVDDASADGSFAIAQEFSAAHANVRAFALAENGGPGIARNEGVRQSRGDWILFLDSDDHLRPGALKRLADFLQSKGGAGQDVVAYDLGLSRCRPKARPAAAPTATPSHKARRSSCAVTWRCRWTVR